MIFLHETNLNWWISEHRLYIAITWRNLVPEPSPVLLSLKKSCRFLICVQTLWSNHVQCKSKPRIKTRVYWNGQPCSKALSLSSVFLVCCKKDPGYSWSQDHPESGWQKICWTGGVAECLNCCCDKLCGFQNLAQSLKTNHFINWSSKSNFTDENCYIISAVSPK